MTPLTTNSDNIDFRSLLLDLDAEERKDEIAVGTTPPRSFGPRALLPFDGICRVEFLDITQGKAKTSGNDKLTIVLNADDEFDNAHVSGTMYKHLPYSGFDTTGEPNLKRLVDCLRSADMPKPELAALLQGSDVPVATIIARLLELRTAYVLVVAKEERGRLLTDVTGFVSPVRYFTEVKAGTAKKARGGVATAPASTFDITALLK